MPILTVKISQPATPERVRAISAALIDIVTGVLGKKRELTAIAIEGVPRRQWIVAGETLEQQERDSFYLDIRVTEGTNTKDEKRRFVQDVFDLFGRLFERLHPESYIHVHEVRADAYGYGGLTQEFRYVKGQLESR